jgi:hypothetical protein
MSPSTQDATYNDAQLLMFVVDVLRYDIERIPSIVKLLNNRGSVGWRFFWPHDFTEKEVISALKQLMQRGLVRPVRYDPSAQALMDAVGPVQIEIGDESTWFALTDQGWQAWEDWHPPIEIESESTG